MSRSPKKRKVDLDLHLPRWLEAMPYDDDDLKHNVIRLLFETDLARRTKGPLKTKQVTDAFAAATVAIGEVRAGTLRGARGARRIDALDTKLSAAMSAAYEATLVTCPTCDSRVAPEAMIRVAERRTKERKPTGCLDCAVFEKRPYQLTISFKQASAFREVIEAHCENALDSVPSGTMIDVDETQIVSELFKREAKRLLDGGELPKFKWRVLNAPKKRKRK